MRGSFFCRSGFLLLIAGVVFINGLENDDLVFTENRLSAVEVPIVEKQNEESYLQRIKRGIWDWWAPDTTTKSTTLLPSSEQTQEEADPDDIIPAHQISEDDSNLTEITTEQKATQDEINSSLERVARESGEENDIHGDDTLVDEESKNERSNDIGHVAEGRRSQSRYPNSDDEDLVGSGEAEGSAHEGDDIPLRPIPKTRFYRSIFIIGEPYRRGYADGNSEEYRALSVNLSETLQLLYRKEAPEDITYVTVVKIENTTDPFKSQVTLDIRTSIPNENDVRNVLATSLERHTLGNIQVSPEGFSFRSFQAGLAPECDSSTELTCRSGSCVPLHSRCDGIEDCDDGSDELDCSRTLGVTEGTNEETGSSDLFNTTERPIENRCRADDVVRCPDGSRYICAVQQCDGNPDCEDGSDEADCPHPGCSIGEFACDVSRCILESDRCNFKVDCHDGSDEHDCDYPVCSSNQFICDNQQCIDGKLKCNGVKDCFDGSDEKNCQTRVCGLDQFECDGGCININLRCDGRPDCRDYSDEVNCNVTTCPGDQFRCSDGTCLNIDKRCNGVLDCRNGDDEKQCANPNEIPNYPRCKSDEFTCNDGACIPNSYYCNNRPDCLDNSDEVNCRGCTREQFQCRSNGVCIPERQRCDLIYNCDDGSDEIDCHEVEETTRDPGPGGRPMPGVCPAGQFKCHSENTCFPISARCNGIAECRDRSDEEHCGDSSLAELDLKTYPNEQIIKENPAKLGREVVFQCRDEGPLRSRVRWLRGNGLPLPSGSTDINGRLEIPNIQLEHAGPYICEAVGHYQRPGNQKVVQLAVEKFDLPATRPPQTCGYDQATCSNGDCIPKSKVCDNIYDCNDGSDEMRCKPYGCEPNEYRCANKQCVSKLWRCDGDKDCADGSDEENCAAPPPGSPCRYNEFQCRTQNQCIPKSYHCDGERDCQDASDEFGCSPVFITKPPQPMVILKPGDVMVLTCTATGVPVPEINWRLNWGHIPEKCTSTSINGTGTLTCGNIQVSDQGAYSCEALNIEGFVFAVPDAILVVQTNLDSICPKGKFNSEATRPEECIPCFCFGVATECKSANLFTYHIPPPFDRHRVINVYIGQEIRVKGDADRDLIAVQPIGADGVQIVSSFTNELDSYDIPYFALPEVYRREQLNSYGGYLKYSVRYSGNGVPNEAPAVILIGNNITLVYKGKSVLPNYETQESIRFFEGYWFKKNGRYEEPARRADIMVALQNVDNILIKAKYDDSSELDVTITNIVFDSADTTNVGLGSAAFIEECMCPSGYSGASCQKCADNHRRVENGQFLGHCVREEVPEICPPGYYGDPSRNIRCNPCPCPLTNPSNQFAKTCHLGPRNEPICDCEEGYVGDRCERCAERFQGNPYRTGCVPLIVKRCDPTGTLYEDPVTGSCRCKSFSTGSLCNQCKDNAFHLALSNPQGCLECFCMGITKKCTSSNWYRNEIRVAFSTSTRDFSLVESRSPNAQPINYNLRVNPVTREIVYNNFPNRGNNDVYYWQLPGIFLGDRITSYGGNLRYTVRYVPSPGGQSSRNNAPDVILISSNNDLTLLHYASSNRTSFSETQQTFTVPLLEQYWQREDGTIADRQYLMVALADVKAIRLKATYTTHTDEAALSMVSLDTAERFNTGRERVAEVEQCSCPAGYKGLSCEDCDIGYTRILEGIYLGSCEPCNCNGHSNQCNPDTGVCENCAHHTTGMNCDRCEYGYEGDATRGSTHDCQRINSTYDPPTCDPAGSENGLIIGNQCMCKRNVEGPRCDRCRPSTFGLSPYNIEGCNQCFCSGVSNQCHESSLYVQSFPIFMPDKVNAFTLTDSSRREVIDTGFELNTATNEIGYRYPDSRSPSLYWSLPKEYTGNKLSSYGSNLTLTQHIVTKPSSRTYPDKDVIIFGNGITLYWTNPRELIPGVEVTYSVTFRESEWHRLNRDGPRRASRIDLMTALADVEAILVRATHSDQMAATYISDIILEFASDSNAGPRATQVEVCSCPEGYDGNSCENCKRGYFRNKSDRSQSYLGRCEKCPCSNNEISCDLNRYGQVTCHCHQGYTGPDCSQLHNPGIPSANLTAHPPPEPTITVSIKEPEFQIVQTGNTVRYHCFGRSKQANEVRIKWEKEGGRLPPGRSIEDKGLLIIRDVTISDSGVYICSVTDGSEVATRNVTLSVGGPSTDGPRALITPLYGQISEEEPFEFRCQASGNPQPVIRWERANGLLSLEALVYGGVLRFTSVRKSDEDEYKCIATNTLGVTETTAILYVREKPQPTISSTMKISLNPTEWTGNSGDTVRITCAAADSTRVTWSRSGNLPLPYSSSQQNGVLTIPSPAPSDSGLYVCTAINYEGIETSQTAKITIVLKPEVPTVKAEPEKQTVSQGSTAEIRCIVSGEPGMQFKWTKHGEPYISSNAKEMGDTLRFYNIQVQDRGIYICRASNARSSYEASAMIEVEPRQAPILELYPNKVQTVLVGGSADMQCRFQGAPIPELHWSRQDGRPFSHNIEQLPGGLLRLTNISFNDEGYYVCSATNLVGSASLTAQIIVHSRPVINISPKSGILNTRRGDRVKLVCTATGKPVPILAWSRHIELTLEQGVFSKAGNQHEAVYEINSATPADEGTYTCRATNDAGVSEESVHIRIDDDGESDNGLYPVPSPQPCRGDQNCNGNIVDFPPVPNPNPGVFTDTFNKIPTGGKLELRCQLYGRDTSHIYLDWRRSGNLQLPSGTSVQNGVLVIPYVTKEAAGEYICLGLDRRGSVLFEAKSILEVVSIPRIELHPTRQIVRPGENPSILCKATGDEPLAIEWRAVGRDMPDSVTRERGFIQFHGITYSDAGKYACVASNPAGTAQAVAEVLVNENEGNVVKALEKDISTFAGNTVKLRCLVQTRATIHWSRTGLALPLNSRAGEDYLELFHVQPEDSGQYICTSSNENGVSSDFINLSVSPASTPLVSVKPSHDLINIGDTVDLRCSSSGIQNPQYTWSKPNDIAFPPNARIYNDLLRLTNVDLSDSGIYRCTAAGVEGTIDGEYELVVQGGNSDAPAIETVSAPFGSDIEMKCDPNLDPPVKFHWKKLEGIMPQNIDPYENILRIKNVKAENAGTYICVANNGFETLEVPNVLVVTGVVPYFHQAPQSYIALAPLTDVYLKFNIEVAFKTESYDGLILYNDETPQGRGDFLSLAIVGGYPVLTFDLGSGPAEIRANKSISLSTWHTVTIHRSRKEGSMLVDGEGPYRVFASGRKQTLDLKEPLYIGGVPRNQTVNDYLNHQTFGNGIKGFVGCISRLVIGDVQVDLIGDQSESIGITSCETCAENPCRNSGICQEAPTKKGYRCLCRAGYSGHHCDHIGQSCYPGACGEGNCVSSDTGFECYCPFGKAGTRCERSVNVHKPLFRDTRSYLAYSAPKAVRRGNEYTSIQKRSHTRSQLRSRLHHNLHNTKH